MLRFLPPILLALTMVATAPFLGELRDAFFSVFGGSAVKVLAAILALVALLVAAVAARRIVFAADRRGFRLGLTALAVTVIAAQIVGFGTPDAQTNVVEKIHILQYGLLAFLFHRALAGGRIPVPALVFLPILWASLVGLLDESTQAFFQLRTGDIRDVAINALSSVSGLLLALAIDPPAGLGSRSPIRTWRRIGDWAALLVLGTGLFIAEMHLGYWIDDPQIGRFRSWFTPDALHRLAQDRSTRWAADPPTGLVPWAREDYFLTEAAWHVNHRDERYHSGDFTMARQANRILETYYAPFLDLGSFRNVGSHHYPPAVARDLDQKALPIDPATYESPVLANRLYTWPSKRSLLLVVGFVAALLSATPRLVARRIQGRSGG